MIDDNVPPLLITSDGPFDDDEIKKIRELWIEQYTQNKNYITLPNGMKVERLSPMGYKLPTPPRPAPEAKPERVLCVAYDCKLHTSKANEFYPFCSFACKDFDDQIGPSVGNMVTMRGLLNLFDWRKPKK